MSAASFVLVIQAPGQPPQVKEISQARTVIGRATGDIVLADSLCSSTHAEILFDGHSVRLRDLGSTNGTWLNGQQLTDFSWAPGVTVQIGGHHLLLQDIRPARQPAGTVVGHPPERSGPSYILLVHAPAGTTEREVAQGRLVVGRGNYDLVLADPGCSSTHAELLFDGMSVRLRDLGSTNGTWLNTQRVDDLMLLPGMQVLIGGHRLELKEIHSALSPVQSQPPATPRRVAPRLAAGPARPPAPQKKKKSKALWILVPVLLLGLCGGGGWFLLDALGVKFTGSIGDGVPRMSEARESTVRFVWFAGQPGPTATGGTAAARIRVGPNKAGTVSVGVSEEFAGGGGNQWRTATWLAAFNATRMLGASLADYEFNVHVGGHTDGPSAGMITTSTMLALIRRKALRTDTTMTGTINPDGTAGPVGGIVQKMEGAKRDGLARFGFPIGCRNHKDMATGENVDLMVVGQRLGLEVREISDVYEAYEFLTGDKLPRTEPIAETEMEPGPQTQALLRAKLAGWKSRLDREIGSLKQEVKATGVPSEVYGPLLAEAEKHFETAQRDERNGFLMPALDGFVQTAIRVSVANRLTTAFVQMVRRDLNGLIQANRTAATVKGEVEAFGQQLEVKAQAKTRGGQVNTTAAFTTYVEARAANMIADDFVNAANAILNGLQSGQIQATPQNLATLMERVALPTLFYDVSRVFLEFAKDLQDLIAEEGDAKPLSSAAVDRTVAGYASASTAVLAYFDALITQEVAKGKGLSMEEAQAVIANKESEYYLARKANLLSEYTGRAGVSDGVKLMRLAAASSAFLSGAKLVNKWYSLGGSFDKEGGVVLENRRALTAQLDLARRNARESAARAKASAGFVPTPARLAYQVANARREGSDDDKLTALAAYWQASFWSDLASFGSR